MAGIPHYSNGQWSEGTDWLDAVWDDREGIENEKSGLGVIAHLGHGEGFSITLYGRNPEHPGTQGRIEGIPGYILEVDAANGCIEYLSAATLADALDLLGRWGPAVTAYLLSEAWHDLANDDQQGLGYGVGLMADILTAAKLAEGKAETRARLARTQKPRRPG